ncbi:MAG: sugar phosphate isomerase/epimerase [Roseiflexaceae bacterium]
MSAEARILVGCGQITWLRFGPNGAEWLVPEDEVHAQIAQAGYAGAPCGPGERSPAEALAFYHRLGMQPAPGYFGADFWVAEQHDDIVARARAFAQFSAAVGLTEMYVATGGWAYQSPCGKNRSQLAGQITAEDGLTDAEMRQFATTLADVCRATLAEGVASCFHNHVGTVIETRAEFERLLALMPNDLLFLGPDTGHLAWAGDDPVAFCRDYASRIKTLHVKDINQAVAEQGRREGWDYQTFSKHGIWTELGRGAIDFGQIFADLKAAGFAGWAIVETDVTQLATPLESAIVSRQYLRSLGL